MIEQIGLINNVSVYAAKGCILVTDYAESQDFALILAALGFLLLIFMVSAFALGSAHDKRKRFMVRKKLENEYEEWLHERRTD